MFTVGDRDFRLPGLGSYLETAADRGDTHAVILGVAVLVVMIVALDQLLWRPLLAWAERFKIESVDSAEQMHSWFRDLVSHSWLAGRFSRRVRAPLMAWLDRRFNNREAVVEAPLEDTASAKLPWRTRLLLSAGAVILLWLGVRAAQLLSTVSLQEWANIGLGLGMTLMRVICALVLALAWTVPLGVAIGTHPKLAKVLQPTAQVMASVPATALFPIVLLFLLQLPGGLNLSAVLLMLLGTQWYLLFNVIAGAAAIPQDLRDTSALLRLSSRERWRVLTLPALFPYIITGAITAVGGAWNASIVAEYVTFGGHTYSTLGIGSEIAAATAAGDYARLLAATLAMILTVVLINRLFWLKLYKLAERRYRME